MAVVIVIVNLLVNCCCISVAYAPKPLANNNNKYWRIKITIRCFPGRRGSCQLVTDFLRGNWCNGFWENLLRVSR